MDQRFLIRSIASGENNRTHLLPSKNIISEQTPRKLPFKDTTNNSSARKVSNIGAKNEPIESKKIQLGQSKNSHQILIDDDFDFIDNFNFPSDRACYCCGNDKKGDGELFYDSLITPEFMEMLCTKPELPVMECEPFSPIKSSSLRRLSIPERSPLKYEEPSYDYLPISMPKFFDLPDCESSNDDSNMSLMEIPSIDLSCSLADGSIGFIDDSVINDW